MEKEECRKCELWKMHSEENEKKKRLDIDNCPEKKNARIINN